MPELPEVEIVKQSLTKNIKGKKIIKVSVRNRNLRFKVKSSFEHNLKNKLISNISRFSKYLIIELENQSFCIIHLGMSGTIIHSQILVFIAHQIYLKNIIILSFFLKI